MGPPESQKDFPVSNSLFPMHSTRASSILQRVWKSLIFFLNLNVSHDTKSENYLVHRTKFNEDLKVVILFRLC